MNLFLTEDGVLKLGYYGLTTQAECYSIKGVDCEGVRSFAPEVFRGKYEMESDVWSLGNALMELMGIAPYYRYKYDRLPKENSAFWSLLKADDIQSSEELADFLDKCFEERVSERWIIITLMNVSVMGWRLMSSIHL